MFAYVISDFSNFNVFQNSHSEKPLIYKISGTWGNHEGSMLLWLSILSIYGFLFSLTKNVSLKFKQETLLIQISLHILFGLFIIFTSNPFLVNSILVSEGLGLNPILQDPGLAIHPPILYAGYVGYSIVFSLAIAGLLNNNSDDWLYIAKKWSLISWTFLTAGIALGSYWAYYELGWGGWWFWDPVENISLMPWIAGLALVHSLLMVKGEQILKKWIIFLSILCFSLSIFGTFLVRSGILTSVHSFASDASRGLFILLIFFIITGFGFLVFLLKTPEKSKPVNFLFINKVSALVINNILMIIATLTILLGTIYPIIVEVLTNDRISVGGPYFNSTVIPIMVPGFLLMSIAPILSWQTNRIRNARLYVLGFIGISFIVLLQSYFSTFNTWGVLGLILGIWIVVASFISIILSYRINYSFKIIQKINPHIAHIGVGIAIIGITCSSVFNNEYEFNINEGDKFQIDNTNISLEKIEITNEINYQALRAKFLVQKNKKIVASVKAGKNYYPVSKIITTEAGIFHEWFRDIYFILGDQKNNNWFVKVYINPFVSFIWIGVFIMVLSGLVGVTKR
tara:strand:- start:1107 stop:2813 length:1707 start_codon:yes stop_codon:yes gene_type:complete